MHSDHLLNAIEERLARMEGTPESLRATISALYGFKGTDLDLAFRLFQKHGADDRLCQLLHNTKPIMVAFLLKDDDLLMETKPC